MLLGLTMSKLLIKERGDDERSKRVVVITGARLKGSKTKNYVPPLELQTPQNFMNDVHTY